MVHGSPELESLNTTSSLKDNISVLEVKQTYSIIRTFFGADETYCQRTQDSIDLHLKIPIFDKNNQIEYLNSEPGTVYEKYGFQIIESENQLIGALIQEVDFPLESQSREIYLNFLQLTQDWNLWRVWNYIPFINEETEGLENYRSFCKGRSLAFEEFYGEDFEVKLPAASAVGINDNKLVLYFIAGKESGIHIENDEQIPAFKYPKRYGPRSPSFARGTLVSHSNHQLGYISGTASIKGAESVTLKTISQQLHTTIDNMSIVCERMGLVERMSFYGPMPDPAKYNRKFKVYIRHEKDFPYLQKELPKVLLLTPEDQVIYLRSDICRSDLDLEIEAVIEDRKSSMPTLIQESQTTQNLEYLFAQTVEKYPTQTAIVYDQFRLTYEELYNQVLGLSKGLSFLGVKQQDCVMVVLPNCPEFVCSIYAAAKLGAIALPVNPLLKEQEIKYYTDDSNPQVIITDLARADLCRQIIAKSGRKIELILIDSVQPASLYFYHLIQTDDLTEWKVNSSYEGDMLYLYSSGSTGRPKKLGRTQKNIFHQALNCVETLEVTAEDNILAMVPMYHSYGFGECMLAAMTTGATLVILEPSLQDGKPVEMPLLFRQPRILDLIEQEKITILPIVPYIASILGTTLGECDNDFSSLRLCISAGNFLAKDIFDQFKARFGVPLRQLYGCTESGAVAINLSPEADLAYDSIGKPMVNVEIRILDDDGEECAPETVGEIVIKSDTLTQGYSNLQELNRETFRQGQYFTGDLGKKDDRGYIYLTGRKKIFIDTGGHKVDPIEVEDVLMTHPQVKEAVVVGSKDFGGQEIIKAVVIPQGTCTEKGIFEYCQERLADFKVPSVVEFRQSLPKNALGKVLRKKV